MGLLIKIIVIGILVVFAMCVAALISSEIDASKIKEERENFAADCRSKIMKNFSIKIPCYYQSENYASIECEVPSIKCQLAVNFRVMRALLCIKHFVNGVLTTVDVYKKSGSGEFIHDSTLSRREYIDILIRDRYTSGTDEKELYRLYCGDYSSQEEKFSTECFLSCASEVSIVRWCENEDFLKDFLAD